MIHKVFHIIIFFALIFLSCDEKFIIVNCLECFDDEPISTTIEIKLDNKEIYDAIVSIYEGNLEDNILLKSFFVDLSVTEASLKVNKRYTITAKYTDKDGNQFIVVDTVYPRVKYETSQCDKPCFYVYDTKIKLRMKYN